jgi:pyridinium-3,5-bisthiocarboxylic acid mononucleotide nickel chelatase
MTRVGWLDCSSGVSGDMLLGALSNLGALSGLPALLASLHDLDVACAAVPTTRQGVAATAFQVSTAAEQPPRRLGDVLMIIDRAQVPEAVRERAAQVFRRLADVEAAAHQQSAPDVHFHEVGAVDAIVDVLGGCLGLHSLGLDELVVSPIALGGGAAQSAHGTLPVPTPAALGLLAGSPLVGYGGPQPVELATPTGVAIVAEWATSSGEMPAMTVDSIGVGAGSQDLAERPNVVRLVVGTTPEPAEVSAGEWQTIEANVDDLDPRLWPGVLDRLITAGAADAWLTPILMKKGRPAHTLSVLVGADGVDAVRDVVYRQTSTLGLRVLRVGKHSLDRRMATVQVGGCEVAVKVALLDGRTVNVQPEFEDVAAAAATLGRPVKDVMAEAAALAREVG